MLNNICNTFSRSISRLRVANTKMSPLLHKIDVPTKKATFGMGCFWGPDSVFGTVKGVISTRVGYCGGTLCSPSYRNLGDHTETIDIDYNPAEITYSKLLDIFWDNHEATFKNTLQYASIIFYHNEKQKELAEKSFHERDLKKVTGTFVTKIVPFNEFHEAERYHQKYRLQQHPYLMEMLNLDNGPLLIESHLAARLNGYVVGFGGLDQFNEELPRLGLNEEAAEYVRKLLVRYKGQGLTC